MKGAGETTTPDDMKKLEEQAQAVAAAAAGDISKKLKEKVLFVRLVARTFVQSTRGDKQWERVR